MTLHGDVITKRVLEERYLIDYVRITPWQVTHVLNPSDSDIEYHQGDPTSVKNMKSKRDGAVSYCTSVNHAVHVDDTNNPTCIFTTRAGNDTGIIISYNYIRDTSYNIFMVAKRNIRHTATDGRGIVLMYSSPTTTEDGTCMYRARYRQLTR